jgi:hypothetical protein
MKIVQLFKTDIEDESTAREIVNCIKKDFSQCKVNFDLEDCDKILRIEHNLAPWTNSTSSSSWRSMAITANRWKIDPPAILTIQFLRLATLA